jgi:hypothetical protein
VTTKIWQPMLGTELASEFENLTTYTETGTRRPAHTRADAIGNERA